jgi:hypothetical protein
MARTSFSFIYDLGIAQNAHWLAFKNAANDIRERNRINRIVLRTISNRQVAIQKADWPLDPGANSQRLSQVTLRTYPAVCRWGSSFLGEKRGELQNPRASDII